MPTCNAATADVRCIAFYLPQFHAIPENDLWWGKGFTEWTNVKKAIPLFKEHYQPRKPKQLGYYELLHSDVMHRQIALARQHGIHGFSLYHYWFKGKKLLEKPIEKFLKDSTLDIPFCLCWANESWTRSWDGKKKQVLLKQDYGDETDWKNHIEYLIKFFKDSRYIKISGAPLFLIYKIKHIPHCRAMLDLWRKEAKKAGFPDLHIIAALYTDGSPRVNAMRKGADGIYEFAPFAVKSKIKMFEGIEVKSYDKIWEKILRLKKRCEFQYRGAFVDWDNTPRRGRKGRVYLDATPEKYGRYLSRQVQRVMEEKQEHRYLFINAWNEWGESCYLEPDERYGNAYLCATKNALFDWQ